MAEHAPASEAELSEIVRTAAAAGRPLHVRGGGTRGLGGAVAGEPVATRGLAGVVLYEPGALTLVARAGTPLAEIEALLEAEGQILPFEPWDGRALGGGNGEPTLGGMVACNASGPRRVVAGACRDSLIGVRFVDGTGSVVKNGGRVMKNVTGLDLVKLLAGSHGTLGVLTEVAFKLLPRPESTATLVLDGLETGRAVAAMTAALGTPFGVSAAAHLPQAPGREAATLVRLEGFAGSVAHRGRALARALAAFGAARPFEGPDPWARVRDAADFAGRPGAVWRISAKPTDGARIGPLLPEAELILDWAGGLVWALLPEEIDLRARIAAIAGHATLVRASAAARARWGSFHPEPAPVAALTAGLRAKFDPEGILNRGRMAVCA